MPDLHTSRSRRCPVRGQSVPSSHRCFLHTRHCAPTGGHPMDFSRRQFLQLAGAGGIGGSSRLVEYTRQGLHAGTAGQPHHLAMPRYGMRHRRHGWKSHGGTLSKLRRPSAGARGDPSVRHAQSACRSTASPCGNATSDCTAICRRRRCGATTVSIQVRRSDIRRAAADRRAVAQRPPERLISCPLSDSFTVRNRRRPRFAPSCTYTA